MRLTNKSTLVFVFSRFQVCLSLALSCLSPCFPAAPLGSLSFRSFLCWRSVCFYRATIADYGVDPLALPRLSRGARDPRQHVRKLAPGFVFLRMKRGREARQLKDEKTATAAGEEREQRAKSEGSVSRDKRLARQLRALGCSITPAAAAAGALVLAMLLLSLSRLPPSCLLPRDSTHDARISLSLATHSRSLSLSSRTSFVLLSYLASSPSSSPAPSSLLLRVSVSSVSHACSSRSFARLPLHFLVDRRLVVCRSIESSGARESKGERGREGHVLREAVEHAGSKVNRECESNWGKRR